MTTSINKSKTSNSIAIAKNKTSKSDKATKPTLIKKQVPKKTKKQMALELLKRSQGASLIEIEKALGWQTHSVRGFLAGTAKKEQGFVLNSEKMENQLRRYRLTGVES